MSNEERRVRAFAERFWEKVDVCGPDECWEWQAGREATGYGRINRGRTGDGIVRAHVASYELAHGPVSKGLMVCHTCDNPPCVNPAHLYAGTASDNHRDARERGLWRPTPLPGEKNGCAKLTEVHVREIRRRYAAGGVSYGHLAVEYGVSENAIRQVVRRLKWKHVA